MGQPNQLGIKIHRRTRRQTPGQRDLRAAVALGKQIATSGEQPLNFTFTNSATWLKNLRHFFIGGNEFQVRACFTLRADYS